jgi:hypothetical protein
VKKPKRANVDFFVAIVVPSLKFGDSVKFYKESTIQERQRRKAPGGFKIPLEPIVLASSGPSMS